MSSTSSDEDEDYGFQKRLKGVVPIDLAIDSDHEISANESFGGFKKICSRNEIDDSWCSDSSDNSDDSESGFENSRISIISGSTPRPKTENNLNASSESKTKSKPYDYEYDDWVLKQKIDTIMENNAIMKSAQKLSNMLSKLERTSDDRLELIDEERFEDTQPQTAPEDSDDDDNEEALYDKLKSQIEKAALEKTAEATNSKIMLTFRIVDTDTKMPLRVSRTESFGTELDQICKELDLSRAEIKFVFDGETLDENESPESLDMEEEDMVDVVKK